MALDSNPWPSEHKPSTITTRQGLPPDKILFAIQNCPPYVRTPFVSDLHLFLFLSQREYNFVYSDTTLNIMPLLPPLLRLSHSNSWQKQWKKSVNKFRISSFSSAFFSGSDFRLLLAVRPDWAIYLTLGNFSKPGATICLSKSPTVQGNFCKGVKIFNFSSEIILGNFYRHLATFYWSHWLLLLKLLLPFYLFFSRDADFPPPGNRFLCPAAIAKLSIHVQVEACMWKRERQGEKDTVGVRERDRERQRQRDRDREKKKQCVRERGPTL